MANIETVVGERGAVRGIDAKSSAVQQVLTTTGDMTVTQHATVRRLPSGLAVLLVSYMYCVAQATPQMASLIVVENVTTAVRSPRRFTVSNDSLQHPSV
ncbi:hypothetical protein RRG08_016192 [Elysia crispata]|uniref:Uncharacterized protein n=1 Tax=Elysia crispata TaxID=231223 RepID=A0AAE0ZPU4_9GAST|nr:hypothetical protein RRG08_016192 [Elysia crispata]